jgi:hypothetical protein
MKNNGKPTRLAAAARGLAAGAIGTAAMDTLLFARYRRGGGAAPFPAWESSAGLSDWDGAPAPALVGKRIVERMTGRDLGPSHARAVNNVMHWAYGMVNGAQYAVVSRRLRGSRLRDGLAFGATVWGAGYVILPVLKLYEPIWHYDAKTLANDLGAHLVYGLTTAGSARALLP